MAQSNDKPWHLWMVTAYAKISGTASCKCSTVLCLWGILKLHCVVLLQVIDRRVRELWNWLSYHWVQQQL